MKIRRQKIQHAVTEIAFIVIGVLIAIAANGWWQGREDRHRESVYLNHLLADTKENERGISAALVQDSILRDRARRMLLVFRTRTPLPPADSLVLLNRWNGVGFNPVTGTYDVMLRTDDIRLLRNDSVRAALVDLDAKLGVNRRALDENDIRQDDLNTVRTGRMIAYLPEQGVPADLPDFNNSWITNVNWAEFRHDSAAQTAYQMMIYEENGNIRRLQLLLSATERLRRSLEAIRD